MQNLSNPLPSKSSTEFFPIKEIILEGGSKILIAKIIGTVDGYKVRPLEEKVAGFFNQGIRYFILNFSCMQHSPGTTGMGLLIKFADIYQEKGGEFILVGLSNPYINLFEMLEILSFFKIYENEEQAIAYLDAKNKMKQNSTISKRT